MKVLSFKEEINKIRSEKINKWQWKDGNKAKIKVVGKALALQSYKKLSNNCLLLNSAASIFVFVSKERFNNFKRSAKRQKLLCNREIVLIEG